MKLKKEMNNMHSLKTERAELFFSYETLVGFRTEGKTVVIQNQWGSTTGKHLNHIDGGNKAARFTPEKFANELNDRGLAW